MDYSRSWANQEECGWGSWGSLATVDDLMLFLFNRFLDSMFTIDMVLQFHLIYYGVPPKRTWKGLLVSPT